MWLYLGAPAGTQRNSTHNVYVRSQTQFSSLINHLSSHPYGTLLKYTLPSTHTLLSYFIHEGAYEVCAYNVPECVHTHFTVYMWGSDGEFFELVFASIFVLSLSFFVLSRSFCTD